MIGRIKIAIPQAEYSSLMELALKDLRTPEQQLHHILREEIQRHGLSLSDQSEEESFTEVS